MQLKPKVALAQDFLLQLSKLPAAVHSKVMKWAIQFQADPRSPGINYENINGARDANLKSVRLDRDWRGIVFKPEAGDVYVLLYVAHHDDAYRWAENRKLSINPVTGAMQLVTFEQVVEPVAPSASSDETRAADIQAGAATPGGGEVTPLYGNLTDTELMSLGVPQELIPNVRGVRTEEGLDAIQPLLPTEAYEGLFLVAAGDTVGQVLQSRETRVDQTIDTSDFATALTTAESQSRFVVVDDDDAMLAIMNAPLAQWRVFLHPTQKKLAVGDRSGPVRVLGGAGTGKTVLAMHRAKWLAENRTAEDQKVLFTTFTKNLALDIEENLRTLCSAETMGRIEVRNLDAWVSAFIRGRKFEHRIVYDRKQDAPLQAWLSALTMKDTSLDLPDSFYEQELEQVILAQGITTLDQYRTARRTGRGVLLSRAKRDAVWPVFEEYRGQLASRKLKEVDDAYREVAEIIATEGRAGLPYVSIIADETQDFGPQALRLLRAMVAPGQNDLFFVGDGHQRIYSRNRAAMSRCGIDIRGRSRKLYLNYRTTDEIRRQAVALLEGCEIDDLDDGHDETRRYKSLSHGPAPQVKQVAGIEEAATDAVAFIRDWRSSQGDGALSFCVVGHSEKSRDTLARQLQAAGLACVTISAQSNHTDAREVIHLATMHRAKGLEFDCVIVVTPSSYLGAVEESEAKRKLLYVALTRAKRGALLLQTG
ncbi:UvrD-helicase domain-containing protein [Aromatoleum petrolei]|uniref:AAA family ATPase n=1 Tax=Aromatoleum petrolei TaxID=76116 RepID=A0ABX1MJW6_9RHOO|nr:UvrD-helicase domain-containing protein [Aromatoleum petrolei]NMF86938.1 AAA family ATPase [Aromatoleum petrolei]QTQ37532.1 ATP-dependent DNA helicase [Aromatoleum petrolei]